MKCLLVIAAVVAVLAIVQAKPPSNNEGPKDSQEPITRPRPIPQQPNEESLANPEIQPVLLDGQYYNSRNYFGKGIFNIDGNVPAEHINSPTTAASSTISTESTSAESFQN